MFSYTSHLAQIKKYPITFLIVPFFLVATSFKPVFNTNNPKTLSIHRSTLKESSNNSTAFYVPRIGLVKEGVLNPGGAGIQPCTTIDYTYYVTNQSTNGELLEFVHIEDLVLGVDIDLSNNPGDIDNDNLLDVGEIWTHTASYTISSIDRVAGQVIANQATVTALPNGGGQGVMDSSHPSDPLADDDTITNISECQPRVSLVKTGDLNPAGFAPCTTIEYSFTVINESLGPDEFLNVQLNDSFLASSSISGPIFDSGGDGKMSPGETWGFNAYYTITQDDIQQGEVQNQAEVYVEIDATGDIITDFSHPSDPLSDDFTVTDLISCQSPELAVLLTGTTADSDNDNCDDVVVYTYQVNNKGNVNLDMISITDDLSTTPILANPNLGDLNNNNILDAGEIWTYTSAHPITPENITNNPLDNQATATANIVGSGTPTSDQSHPTDESSAGLTSVDVSGACDNFDAGISLILRDINLNCTGSLEYLYEVTRAGSVNLQNITLTDNLGNIIITIPTGDDNNNDVLEDGETWTYTSTAYNITQDELNLGAVTNQATVTAVVENTLIPVIDDSHPSDPQDDDVTITDLTSCQSPELAVLLSGSTDDTDNDNCDNVVIYTYEVINKGNVDLDTVGATDILTNTIVLVTDPNNNGILDVGETQFYTATHDITEDNIANMVLDNQATATANIVGSGTPTSDQSHPTDESSAGLTSIDVSGACDTFNAGISLILSVNNPGACTGSLEYQYEVTRAGSVNLVNIVLSDDLGNPIAGPNGDANSNDVLEAGETWTYTSTYNITQGELNLGAVTNQATVNAVVQNTLIPLTDDSHPSDPLSADVTVADLTSCQNPVVEMLLTSAALPVDTDADTCPDAIDYIYRVRNSGNVDLNIASLVDNLTNLISLPNPNNGDVDSDNQLDIGEEWVYTSRYDILQDDIDNSPLENQATLLTTIVGSLTQVPDELSHPTDFTDQSITFTDVTGTCADTAAIGIIKEADVNSLIDTDADGCLDAIQYTIRVSNEGNVDLTTIVVNDSELGNDIPGPSSGDDGNGILEPNEIWVYQRNYDILETDIINNNGDVTGQAEVFAVPAVGIQISDLSHPTLFDDDADTVTNVTGTCFDTVAVGLTKIDTGLIDSDLNGCDDQIEYTLIIHNLGGMNLNITELHDDQLNDITAGPFLESGNADGVLEIGETWQYDGIGIYNITEPDATLGSVTGRARVTAQPVGTAVFIMDESHPIDETDVGDTVVPIPGACADGPSIAVTRVLQMIDTDTDGCNDQIDFILVVSNSGGLDLNSVILTDDQLSSPVVGPDDESINTNGILEVGEEWTYTGFYDISQTDVDGGDVFSRAVVDALSVVGNIPVQDFSHPTDPADDADNEILFSGACDDTVGISIIRNTVLEDSGDGDNCTDRIAITIEVTNTGNAPLENVVVNDDLLVNAPTLSSNGNGDIILDSGETWEYTGSYDLDQTDIDGINVIGGADVTAQHIGSTFQVSDDSHPSAPNLDQDNDNDVSGACANTAAITLTRTPNLSDNNMDNCPDTIDFRIVVTNSGQVDLDTVVLTDDQLPSPVIGPDDESINTNGILEVGEEWIYTGSYNITPENIANTPLISGVTVIAEPLGSTFQVSDNDQNNIDLSSACASFSAAVSVTLLDSLSDSNNDGCDDRIIYTYTVSNIGSEDLGQIVLTDDLGNTITAPTPNPGDLDNDNEIDQMEDWVFTATYFITQTDIDNSPQLRFNQANVSVQPIGNTTNVTSDSNTTSTDVSSACLNDTASIGLIKTASLFDSDGDNCNDSVLYFFTVENLGNIALENILLEDFFLGITLTEPNSRNLNEDEILNVGEQWNYNLVRPIVQQDIDRAFIENQAMVTAYRTDLPDTFITDFSHQSTYTLDDLTSISVIGACINTSAGIGLVKTGVLIDLNEDGCLESIRYTFRIANLGNQPLTGLLLRDDLFENPIEGPLSGDDNDNDILEVDEEWTYTVVYGITQEDLNIGFVENQATITANVVGQENFIVNDISDSDLFTRDNLTRVSVIEACLGGTISDSDFKIFTGITPNGDGINDFFRIQGIERYPNNTLKIYNRWGVMVYEVEEYGEGSNLFNGISIGRATIAGDKELPSGTYFYILSFLAENPGEENYSGYLYINRN
ncbi:DUF7507 domain-containing protein [Flagellimonas sp. W118]|uniref:DUF7507 domain-containing protein n=1 Tax=Flagellimonas sp. W118 TaxID=3410791 RepID=UPI003BF4BEFC